MAYRCYILLCKVMRLGISLGKKVFNWSSVGRNWDQVVLGNNEWARANEGKKERRTTEKEEKSSFYKGLWEELEKNGEAALWDLTLEEKWIKMSLLSNLLHSAPKSFSENIFMIFSEIFVDLCLFLFLNVKQSRDSS